MFERSISPADVREIVESGEIINDYPDDIPYPSKLILGYAGKRPIHLVLGYNETEQICIAITMYEPSKDIWKDDFKEKRN
jgi:uncharacterized protein DUF4258